MLFLRFQESYNNKGLVHKLIRPEFGAAIINLPAFYLRRRQFRIKLCICHIDELSYLGGGSPGVIVTARILYTLHLWRIEGAWSRNSDIRWWQAVDGFEDWASRWRGLTKINGKRSDSRNELVSQSTNQGSIEDSPLPRNPTVKYLGVVQE